MQLLSCKSGRGSFKRFFSVECLEQRAVPAAMAYFNSGILHVEGDRFDNDLLVAADADGNLTVTNNGEAVEIQSLVGEANVAETDLIVMKGRRGNDTLTTDISLNVLDDNGVLVDAPNVTMYGGNGHDTLTVGHGGIVGGLAGVDENGVVVGDVVGNATMYGGRGHDTLNSGFGNDIMFGNAGNDTYIWPPGTLTDIWVGGRGYDTAIIIGNDTFLSDEPAGDEFLLTANGRNVRFQRTNLVQFTVDISSTESVVMQPGDGDDVVTIGDLSGVRSLKTVIVEGAGGNDIIDASAQANRRVSLIAFGGDGNDTILGGAGFDILAGEDGNDDLNGGGRTDVISGGAGEDTLDGGEGRLDFLVGGEDGDTFVDRPGSLLLDFDVDEGDVLETPGTV